MRKTQANYDFSQTFIFLSKLTLWREFARNKLILSFFRV
jgi:hypothetical protein